MRTFPSIKLGLFRDPNERSQIKVLADFARQVSGGLARSIQSGQSPSANATKSLVNPTAGPPPPSGVPIAQQGDTMFGLYGGAWTNLHIGPSGYIYASTGREPEWVSPSTLRDYQITWKANGPYQVGTAVDGGVVAPSSFTITAVWLYRGTAGTSLSTIVDLNKDTGAGPVTMYSTPGNRPEIAYGDTDKRVLAVLPDILTVSAGDVLTMDIDQIEGGTPMDLTLVIEGS